MEIFKLLGVFIPFQWSMSLACLEIPYGKCELQNNHHLICFGASPSEYSLHTAVKEFITNVTICAWPYKKFKVEEHLGQLTGIQHFTLTQSGVEQVESFQNHRKLLTVNVTWLMMTYIKQDLFLGLELLHSVDLRHNRLSFLDPEIFLPLPNLRSLYLAGNNWMCNSSLIWIISEPLGSKVCDRDMLLCEGNSSGLLKAYPKPLMQVVKMIQVMQSQCPSACNCSLVHVVRAYTDLVEKRGQLLPHISVNCSHRNLSSMPSRLPDYTTALYLNNNNITEVEELAFNEHYKDVRDVFLDYNKIKSINILEGSDWINNFGILSLRGNHLQEIPLYALDHAFGSQSIISHIFLGKNIWKCNCEFTIHFRDFLKKYTKVITDIEDVRCQRVIGDENSDKKIVDLHRLDLCQNHVTVKLTFVDKLNIFLASMLFLVISTFFYNLTIYKTTGKLPWMVAKLF